MDAERSVRHDDRAAGAPKLDNFSLPGWIYRNSEFLEAERERIFAPSWHIV